MSPDCTPFEYNNLFIIANNYSIMGPLLEERVVNSDEKKTKNFKESKLDEGLSLKKYRNRFFIGLGIYYGICFAANYIYNHPETYKPLVDFFNR